jgi:hypothetical protein
VLRMKLSASLIVTRLFWLSVALGTAWVFVHTGHVLSPSLAFSLLKWLWDQLTSKGADVLQKRTMVRLRIHLELSL